MKKIQMKKDDLAELSLLNAVFLPNPYMIHYMFWEFGIKWTTLTLFSHAFRPSIALNAINKSFLTIIFFSK